MANPIWAGTTTNYATAANWLAGSAPAASDNVYFDGTSVVNVDGTTGSLNQSGTALTSFNVRMDYTGFHGGATTSAGPLQITASTVNIGTPTPYGSANGSGELWYDFGTSTTMTVNVLNSSNYSNFTNLPPVQFKGGSSGNPITANISAGNVGIGTAIATDTAYVTTLNVLGGSVSLGANVTVTTLEQSGGTVTNATTVNMTTTTILTGTYNFIGNAAHAAVTVGAQGKFYHTGAGNLTGTVEISGRLDFSGDPRAKQITNGIKANAGCTINLANGQNNITADGTNPVIIYLQNCDLSAITLTLGSTTVKVVRQ